LFEADALKKAYLNKLLCVDVLTPVYIEQTTCLTVAKLCNSRPFKPS